MELLEEIMPKEYVDAIRARTGCSPEGASRTVVISIDTRSLKDDSKAIANALAPALRRLGRNASPTRA